jgi:hypothetical protein
MKNMGFLFVLLLSITWDCLGADDLISTGMNKIDALEVVFREPNGSTGRIDLVNNEGTYRYEYGINIVTIDYWNKTAEFDARYRYDNRYYPDEYMNMEINLENRTSNFRSIFFNQNITKNEMNDIVFIDSFCFSVFEAESIFLSRRIYLSTNNFNIRITIQGKRELINRIVEETPNYFKIRTAGGNNDIEYNDETKEMGWPVWDYRNDATNRFGNDLLGGRHHSETVNIWYSETEEIMNGIGIK